MTINVRFFKDRQKFSAAHFTLFPDGNIERLHGHNYVIEIGLMGEKLRMGLIFPFHLVKPEIQKLCDKWDERILLPKSAEWVKLSENGSQVEVQVDTPREKKFYSFPKEDTVILECDNVSCENLANLYWRGLAQSILPLDLSLQALEVTLSESSGQAVTVSKKL